MKKIMRVLIMTSLLFALISTPAFAHTEGDPFTTDLIAGGGNEASAIDVGDVLTWNDGEYLYVKYVITDIDWCIVETHLQVATQLDTIPQKNGNPIPGKFTYNDSHACVSNWLYQIPITWDVGTNVQIVAHAVVEKPGGMAGYELTLPDQVTMMVIASPGDVYGAPSYFDVAVSGGTMLDGLYDSYCVDRHAGLYLDQPYNALVFSSYSYEGLPPGRVAIPTNFDLVNYILNQHYVGKESPSGGIYNFWEVQRAIWKLIEDTDCSDCWTGPWTQSHVDEIVEDALTYGEGFQPACGDVLAIILLPWPEWGQIIIIEVPAPCMENIFETAWGDGSDFPGANWATYITYGIQQ
jgi:hypothetical protein